MLGEEVLSRAVPSNFGNFGKGEKATSLVSSPQAFSSYLLGTFALPSCLNIRPSLLVRYIDMWIHSLRNVRHLPERDDHYLGPRVSTLQPQF
jgi:hypothetical protein